MSRAAVGVVKANVDVPLASDQRADAAAAAVLRRLREVVVDNLPGSVEGGDPEYLHQLRIAVRRTRAVQRQLARVFPPLELAGFRSEFHWLQRATGDARDFDVYVAEFDALRALLPEDMRDDLGPLRPVLAHDRLTARAEMARALTSRRTVDLLEDWERLLETLVELPLEDRPDAGQPIAAVAGRRIRRVYRKIARSGRALDAASPAPEYHALRKQAKELRYLLELFGEPLFDGEHVTPMVKALKAVQDVLGRHQDREVQVAMLRAAAGEVAGLPGGGRACLAMGVLVERLCLDERAARQEFAKRFAAFAGKEQRALVREVF